MKRQAQASFRVASTLSLALSCASCLVTNELDFEPFRSSLNVFIISPPPVFPVPSAQLPLPPDVQGLCSPDEVSFVASYYYEDVEQALYVVPLVNDNSIAFTALRAKASPDMSPYHEPPAICVSRDLLGGKCSRVELFVSDNEESVQTNDPNALRSNPRVASVTWYLYGPSADALGGSAKPTADFYDCLPPDGGRR